MRDYDRFTWPPRKSDLLLFAGLGLVIYSVVAQHWGLISAGVVLMIVGLLVPRMKGPFALGGPKLQFRGELVDPGDGSTRQQDEPQRSAPREPLALQAPPPESQPPPEQPQ